MELPQSHYKSVHNFTDWLQTGSAQRLVVMIWLFRLDIGQYVSLFTTAINWDSLSLRQIVTASLTLQTPITSRL